jgi:hypothetical protein
MIAATVGSRHDVINVCGRGAATLAATAIPPQDQPPQLGRSATALPIRAGTEGWRMHRTALTCPQQHRATGPGTTSWWGLRHRQRMLVPHSARPEHSQSIRS